MYWLCVFAPLCALALKPRGVDHRSRPGKLPGTVLPLIFVLAASKLAPSRLRLPLDFKTMRFLFHSLIAVVVIGFAATAVWAQDKSKAKEPSPDDQYVPGPESKEQPGVPKGEVTKYSWNESKV